MTAYFSLALPVLLLLVLLALGGAMAGWLAKSPAPQRQLAGFSTSLKGRTRGQRHNAQLAARSLDNRVVAAGGVFSFNQAVQSWSVDQGYSKALVSYDGELVRAYGGGVCQTSTTLYNAALLAGLPILERHPHVFVPGYIKPGRDAAVAYPGIDLRFRNPFVTPIRIRAQVRGERLEVSLVGASGAKNAPSVRIESELLSVTPPQRLTRVRQSHGTARRAYLHSAGAAGYRVVTHRVFAWRGRETRRECLGDDTYPPMNRVIALLRDAP